MRRNCLLALGRSASWRWFAGVGRRLYNWRGPWRPATPRARPARQVRHRPQIYFGGVSLVFILQLNIYSGEGESPRECSETTLSHRGSCR